MSFSALGIKFIPANCQMGVLILVLNPLLPSVQGLRFVYPQDRVGRTVEVTAEDLNRLEPEEFLNDTVIDFYLR